MVTDRIAAAHHQAVKRLILARGSIREAFDSLGCGVTFEDLIVYVERDFHAKAAYGAPTLEQAHARIVGIVAGACITAVESDRLTPRQHPQRPTRSEQSLEGAAVNGLTPVGQEADSRDG